MKRSTSSATAKPASIINRPDSINTQQLDDNPDFYNINQALDYTCARLKSNKVENKYCGQCDTCQIRAHLGNCRQWFTRASHLTIKNFVLDLVKSIKITSIYNYLNNLLKISIDSKDFVYSRNKLIPSIKDDHLIISNDRCSNMTAVDESINVTINWYKNSNYYIKLNFMISLLKECEQSIIYNAILQIKTIIEAPRTLSAFMSDGGEYSANNNQISFKITPSDGGNLTFRSATNAKSKNGRVTITATSDYEDEIINDTDDDESFNADFDITALYANVRIGRKAKHVDFIRQLPVHLSKRILSQLNKKNLYNCLFVSKFWNNIVKETRRNANSSQMLLDDMMLLRGTTSKICNPKYANDIDVKVPNLKPGTFQIILKDDEAQFQQKTKSDFNWANAYKGISTRLVIMEERNVFCGSYNVLLLKDKRDSHRVVSINGKNRVALGSFDKKIRFIDIKTAEDMPMSIQGHAGSIKCIFISEARNYVITGSYDTSIRCWSLTTGKCLRIFQGHQSTVTCIAFCEANEQIISGSYDKTCRVWSMRSRINQRVFKHKYPISAVAAAHEDMCISGGYKGKVKVFNITSGTLIKVISAHTGIVTGIKFDKWHAVTCSTDGYALAFSAQGNHKKGLMAMRHPKAVLCVEFQYLRAITGSADGKVRIWNILNGDCLRVMRGNSQCDPVLSLSISFNRILINTEFNVILMEFEPVVYEYGGKRELESENMMMSSRSNSPDMKQKRSYAHIRAARMEVVGTPNVKIFNDDRKSVMSHSSGPISTKTLEEARIIQQPRSTLSNSKLSIVTINTPMTFNTLSSAGYQKSVLSYVNVQSEINLNSKNEESTPGIKLDLQNIDQEETNVLRYKKLTLDETKTILRNQLRNMRKSSSAVHRTKLNSTPTSSNAVANKDDNKKVDTKSCIETALVNRNQSHYDIEQKSQISLQKRPNSSPGFYDTKTKLKLTADEFQQFLTNKNDQPMNSSRIEPTASRNSFVKTPSAQSRPITVKSAVTKIFESQELNLKTNTNMYPPNINSRIPNPKVVSVIRASSSFEVRNESPEFRTILADSDSQMFTSPSHTSIQQKNTSQAVERPRAQTALERRPPPFNHAAQKPPVPVKRTQSVKNEVVENFETNKLLAGDNLKLMTHKEVDDIMNRINVLFDISQIKKKKEEEKNYKKLWLLKSTGAYHGSLLAKQKAFAPEIRE